MTDPSLQEPAIALEPQLTLPEKVRYELVSVLARVGRASFLLSLINAILAYYILRDVADLVLLNAWLLVIVVISALRAVMVAIFWRVDQRGRRLSLWIGAYLLLVYGSAACWGVLAFLDAFFAASWSQSFIVFLIAGMSAGGLISLYPLLRAAIPYLAIILLPLIVTLASSDQQASLSMAVFSTLYFIFLVRSTYLLNYSVKKSIRLEIENENLFEFLSTASEDQAASRELKQILDDRSNASSTQTS